MNVEKAEAQLGYAKAAQAYLAAKTAYSETGDVATFRKAKTVWVAALDAWSEWRSPGDAPGDATADPNPVSVSLEVN